MRREYYAVACKRLDAHDGAHQGYVYYTGAVACECYVCVNISTHARARTHTHPHTHTRTRTHKQLYDISQLLDMKRAHDAHYSHASNEGASYIISDHIDNT